MDFQFYTPDKCCEAIGSFHAVGRLKPTLLQQPKLIAYPEVGSGVCVLSAMSGVLVALGDINVGPSKHGSHPSSKSR